MKLKTVNKVILGSGGGVNNQLSGISHDSVEDPGYNMIEAEEREVRLERFMGLFNVGSMERQGQLVASPLLS